MRRLDCHDRIKKTKSSYDAALKAVTVVIRLAEEQPDFRYNHNLDLTEMRALEKVLHDVYFVRMFACFESSIRHYWWNKIRETKPLTEQLLSSMAGRLGVPQDTLDTVHEIRSFRNILIHEDHRATRQFTIDEASGPLNTYLARLPREW